MKTNVTYIIYLIVTISLIGCASPSETKKKEHGQSEMLANILCSIPSVGILVGEDMTIAKLAGHYSEPGPSSKKQLSYVLSGSDLYLFPDQTYIYVEWADILPPTIYEKGQWVIDHGFIVLNKDQSLPKSDSPKEHSYLPITLSGNRANNILLMGNGLHYELFIETLGGDPQFKLFSCSLEFTESISKDQAVELKAKLLKNSWKPEFFSK